MGADQLIGGLGNDTYIADGSEHIVEHANQGADTVRASATLTLGAQLENLVLTGADAIDGTGNGLANVIKGNAAANTLKGAGGNDRLYGGRRNDRLEGGTGNDVFVFDTALSALTNRDTVADFANVAGNVDTIALDNAVFAKFGAAGALNANLFRIGSVAADANDYLVYNQARDFVVI
jgi:Ca2+-binding RTX toxin-like protein